MDQVSPYTEYNRKHRLLEVTGLFLKLGAITFGGPAAGAALIEQEVVNKRRWLSPEHFLDLLAATNLVPGANVVEMAVHVGYIRAGWLGLVAGGVAFIIPAFLISLVLSVVYVRLGTLPQGAALFYGINPVVMAIILVATYHLGRAALKDKLSLGLAVASLAAALLGVNEVIVLLAAGLAGIFLYAPPHRPWPALLLLNPGLLAPALLTGAAWFDDRLVRLAWFFLKVGTLLFGSGMVLFAFIHRDVVTSYGWLTEQQLLDAIAVGQITPGPVLSSATFIGYLVAGWPGAVVSTIAIFLPSFVIVAFIGPWIPRLRQSRPAQAFLRGVNAAVVALILAVSLALFRSAIVDGWTVLLLVIGLVALLRFKLDTLWLVAGGAGAGLVHYLVSGG